MFGKPFRSLTVNFKFNVFFLTHLQLYQVANLCLVAQRHQYYLPLNRRFLAQFKAVVHKSDRVGASLNMFKQSILEWIYNTREMNVISFNSHHQILTSPAPQPPLHRPRIAILKTNLTLASTLIRGIATLIWTTTLNLFQLTPQNFIRSSTVCISITLLLFNTNFDICRRTV